MDSESFFIKVLTETEKGVYLKSNVMLYVLRVRNARQKLCYAEFTTICTNMFKLARTRVPENVAVDLSENLFVLNISSYCVKTIFFSSLVCTTS